MAILRAYRGLLVDRALIRLLFGEFVSSIGDWLYLVALLVIVYDRSKDPVLLGVVGAARVLPYVLLSVPAGIVADRYDRRLVLLVTDLVRGAIMLAMAALVAFGGPDGAIWPIVALAILATCFSSFFGPTIGAFLPSLVGDESRLGPANSAWASLDNLAFVIGPAIAGVLISLSGLTAAFLLNAISFAIVAAVLWQLPGARGKAASPARSELPAPEPEPAKGPTPEPAVAPPSARSIAIPIAGLALLDIVASFAFGGLSVLTVVLATTTFHAGEEATGYLNAAIGVGGLVAAVVSGALMLRPSLVPPLLGGSVLLALGFAGLGAVGSIVPALVAMTVAAAGSLLVEVVDATIFQRVVPDALRGRALGVIATVSTLAYAGGAFALPVLADPIGVGPVLGACGVAVLIAAVIALVAVGPAATRTADPDEALLRRVAGLPLFTGIAPGRLEAILGRRTMRDVVAGQAILRQGEPADRFAVIVSGRFDVTRIEPGAAEAVHLRTMGPDDVFGEIGLLTGVPRTATVTAATDGRLLELEGADFLELVAAGPGVANRFLDLHRGGGRRRCDAPHDRCRVHDSAPVASACSRDRVRRRTLARSRRAARSGGTGTSTIEWETEMPASKRDSDGFAKNRATEGEGFASRRATEDDDVEGHSIHRGAEGQGFSAKRKATEDDVEGHAHRRRDAESEGFSAKRKATEDDVEGHAHRRRDAESEGFSAKRKATEDDDVEGHAFSRLRSPSSRGE